MVFDNIYSISQVYPKKVFPSNQTFPQDFPLFKIVEEKLLYE